MLHFHIITLFPDALEVYVSQSILGRAIRKKYLKVSLYNPRDFIPRSRLGGASRNRKVDDRPYGGGPGMVLKAEPVLRAVEKAIGRKKKVKVIFFSPSGRQFGARDAIQFAKDYKDVVLIAGHYEGVDARVQKILRAEPLSIGPYVLTGGEIPAMIVIDAVARHVTHVLGSDVSLEERRVASREVYTRPEVLFHKGKTYRVPRVLLSGHHKKLDAWRAKPSRRSRNGRSARC